MTRCAPPRRSSLTMPRKLQQLVAERTASLRETVHELEAFSYSISHDLRAPLRAMQSFAQLLCNEHASQLDPAGRKYLESISTAAARLDVLIQEVLNYTRILREKRVCAASNWTNWSGSSSRLTRIGSRPKQKFKSKGRCPPCLAMKVFSRKSFPIWLGTRSSLSPRAPTQESGSGPKR